MFLNYLQGSDHCVGEDIRIVLTTKVQPVHLLVVSPLEEATLSMYTDTDLILFDPHHSTSDLESIMLKHTLE